MVFENNKNGATVRTTEWVTSAISLVRSQMIRQISCCAITIHAERTASRAALALRPAAVRQPRSCASAWEWSSDCHAPGPESLQDGLVDMARLASGKTLNTNEQACHATGWM